MVTPVGQQTHPEWSAEMTELDYGPAEFIVARFDGDRPSDEFWKALVDLVATGTIRLLDLLFVSRSADGEIELLEYEDLGDSSLTLEASGLAGSEDVDDIADLIQPGTSGAVVVLEHLWAKQLTSAFFNTGGEVVYMERIPAPAVNALLAETSREDEGAELEPGAEGAPDAAPAETVAGN